MTRQADNKGYGTLFFAVCVMISAWHCFVMAVDTQLGGVGGLLHNWRAAAIALANALLLLAPYWLLPRRWRCLVWIPVVLLTLWCLMHMCYCRVYDDLMPWRSFALTGNVNTTLAASTLSLLRWQDLLVALPPLGLLAIHIVLRRRHVTMKSDTAALKPFLVTIATALLVGVVGYIDGDTNWARRFLHNYSNRSYYARNGLLPYAAFTLLEEFRTRSITSDERAQLQSFLDQDCPHYSDNNYCRVAQRNLVLLIVESLHTWPIGMTVDGREVTPVLNALVSGEQQGVIYAPHVLFQTSHGHSSDAHFIYNTGLLPLLGGAVAVSHGDGPYPTLAAALVGYDCREVICTPGINWNQTVTARTYGMDSLYTRDDLVAAGDLQRCANVDDAALTAFAARLLPQLQEPFFLEMVTMTMHAPYTATRVPQSWIMSSDTLNAEARGYLSCVHLTDSCIGAFINDLHRAGLSQRTVVAIVSDHTQLYLNRVKGLSDRQASPRDWGIPLIIAGCDTTLRYEPVIGQVDIFPTLLDVMGANSNSPWKGLGHSILRYPVTSAIQPRNMSVIGDSSALTSHQRQAWDFSRLLILDRHNWHHPSR